MRGHHRDVDEYKIYKDDGNGGWQQPYIVHTCFVSFSFGYVDISSSVLIYKSVIYLLCLCRICCIFS